MTQAQTGTGRTLPKMIVVRIGWMTYYAGAQNERPIGGGSYTKDNVGYESCNFLDLDGQLRGYFRFQFGKIKLERIDPVAKKADYLDDVLVVFASTDPKGGQFVIGWYKQARVYRHIRPESDQRRSFERDYFDYYFEAPTAEAVLLPLEERKLSVPREGEGMVQTTIFYPYDQRGKPKNLRWLEQVVDFVNDYDGDNLLWKEQDEQEIAVTALEEKKEGKGQGFAEAEVRQAIEKRAMQVVEEDFRKNNWVVVNKSNNNPYDFLAIKGSEELFIEVKGTRGQGKQVFLTRNEVRWARDYYPQTVLAIVTNIQINEVNGKVEAKEGKLYLIQPWQPTDTALEPFIYTYQTNLKG